MDWLHWVGREYYTQKSFIKEANKYDVTRRVSLQVAKQMSWGDRVFCAMLNRKKGEIFGHFTITSLSGLSGEVIQKVNEETEVTMTDPGGEKVEKGCGEYTSGPTFQTEASLEEVVEIAQPLKEEEKDIGKPMVGGTFQKLEPITLIDIPFRQGFRTINGKALLHSAECNGRRVQGQFYPDKDEAEPLLTQSMRESGLLQILENYKKKVIGEKAVCPLYKDSAFTVKAVDEHKGQNMLQLLLF